MSYAACVLHQSPVSELYWVMRYVIEMILLYGYRFLNLVSGIACCDFDELISFFWVGKSRVHKFCGVLSCPLHRVCLYCGLRHQWIVGSLFKRTSRIVTEYAALYEGQTHIARTHTQHTLYYRDYYTWSLHSWSGCPESTVIVRKYFFYHSYPSWAVHHYKGPQMWPPVKALLRPSVATVSDHK